MLALLQAAVAAGALRAVDLHFARRLQTLAGREDPELLLAAALASQGVGQGDVCVSLDDCADLPLVRAAALAGRLRLPEPAAWAETLRRSPVVGAPGERAPLILDPAGRLYLGRYWHFERVLADALAARAGTWVPRVDRKRLRTGLDRLFPPTGEPDWQRLAAAMAVLRPLAVISGGPGTGKTRTVTSILALLIESLDPTPAEPHARRAREDPDEDPARPSASDPSDALAHPDRRIALAAPTGKAAARLTESIRREKARLPLTTEVAARIPDEAVTLHRLLGFRPGRANPRHGPQDPLHLDTLVVDEASMVDLPLMARLLAALPDRARLILLGDKDQLASVEAGMVLGDICGRGAGPVYTPELHAALRELSVPVPSGAEETAPPIGDHLVVLRKSWRFDEKSGIGALARAVKTGDGDTALAVLKEGCYPDLRLVEPEPSMLARHIAERVVPAFRAVLAAPTPDAALGALDAMRVLCAVREGPLGVGALNRLIEARLESEGLIRISGDFYPGRPLMVTVNDHAQGLYNGDLGLVRPDPESGDALRVFFATAEGVRRVLPSRLPPHETLYAMTVHKSQGSEFASVLLILPETETRLVTRELVYTGITRARETLTLFASEPCLRQAIGSRISRSTGLYQALWTDAGKRREEG